MAFQGDISDTKLEITGQQIYTEPPRHEWTCGNCKFWEAFTVDEKFPNVKGHGLCVSGKMDCDGRYYIGYGNFPQNDYNMLYYTGFDGAKNEVATGENFGCINFERK